MHTPTDDDTYTCAHDEAPCLERHRRRIVWNAETAGSPRLTLFYRDVLMHAVSHDTSSFHSPCVYMQVEGGSLPAVASSAGNGHGTQPMEVGADAVTGREGKDGAGGDDGGDDDDDDDDDGEAVHEVRLVPLLQEGSGSEEAALEAIYNALSECAALNPENDDDDSDEWCGVEEDDGAIISGMAEIGGDGEAPMDREHMTSEQLAMLDRYDAMLDDASTQAAMAATHNEDGRFDDAEDDAPAS